MRWNNTQMKSEMRDEEWDKEREIKGKVKAEG